MILQSPIYWALKIQKLTQNLLMVTILKYKYKGGNYNGKQRHNGNC